jgi:3',5'-cyclic AMP phosphodiesterase CpdA
MQWALGGLGMGAVLHHHEASAARAEDASPLTVAFLTDTHLPHERPEVHARLRALMRRIQSRPTPPDLFVFGGDNVMAVDGDQPDAATDEQFRLWGDVIVSELRVPSLSVIGNHDIRWSDRRADDADARHEKSRALAAFAMPARYYRREHGGWTFLLLDTFQREGCELDEPQWTWLTEQLKQGDTPVCVVTHAPLLSATHFLEPSTADGHGYRVPAGWSPKGLVRFRELFREHARVKLCLSGHMHTCDRVDIDHTSYVCGGAVSGNWWDRADDVYLGFGPTWIELRLHADGRWSHERCDAS